MDWSAQWQSSMTTQQRGELGGGLEQGVHGREEVRAVRPLALGGVSGSPSLSAAITRRPGRRRDRAGCSSATLATSSGSSASSRPSTSENGR